MSVISNFVRKPFGSLEVNFMLLLLLIAVAIFGPILWGIDPTAMSIAERFSGPSISHPLGQDDFGRDIFSRVMYGARTSLAVAFTTAVIAGVIGTFAGIVGGYFAGIWEFFTLRVSDVLLSFPPILLALMVVALFGPSTVTLIACLSLLYMPNFARVAYGETLSIKQMEYIEAQRALGAKSPRILFRTLLPNIGGPLMVQFSLTVSQAIIVEAGLSFLGLGIVPPTPSWGLMIRSTRSQLAVNPIGLLWPSLCLIITVFIVNRLLDALQNKFDPRGAVRRMPKLWSNKPTAPATVAAELPEDQRLEIRDLRVQFASPNGPVTAVEDVSLAVAPGEILAVVGESGSGKSVTSLSISRLLPQRISRIDSGQILLRGGDGAVRDTATMTETELREIRGAEVATIFQEPMTSLNPVYRVGDQIMEAIGAHNSVPRAEARRLALQMLERVGMSDPVRRLRQYPHELSGGMRQRALIALALSCNPSLLIADEPTTALDVTIQAEILQLIRRLQDDSGGQMSVLFVTHNLGIVAQIADRVVVMYAGRVVETGTTEEIFSQPRHPYTKRLLGCIPKLGKGGGDQRLETISGSVPTSFAGITGCAFADRCLMTTDKCREAPPALFETDHAGHRSRCFYWESV